MAPNYLNKKSRPVKTGGALEMPMYVVASRRRRRQLLRFQLKRPISEALICNARYFEYIRHWAKLPAINQRPG
jgi:hypothetical protein